MSVPEEIHHVTISDEFRQCRNCGYERGFHTSLLRIAAGRPHFRVVMICPECGSRYDARWVIEI